MNNYYFILRITKCTPIFLPFLSSKTIKKDLKMQKRQTSQSRILSFNKSNTMQFMESGLKSVFKNKYFLPFSVVSSLDIILKFFCFQSESNTSKIKNSQFQKKQLLKFKKKRYVKKERQNAEQKQNCVIVATLINIGETFISKMLTRKLIAANFKRINIITLSDKITKLTQKRVLGIILIR